MGSGRRYDSPRVTELRHALPNAAREVQDSPVVEVPTFDRGVLSWNGEGKWRLEMRVRIGDVFSPYFVLGILDGDRQRSASEGEMSTEAGAPLPVGMETDTLVVRGSAKATAFQVRTTGEGTLRALVIAHYRRDDRLYTEQPAVPGVWGTTLSVPERSQRDAEDPAIRPEACSPTSIAMMLEYHGVRRRTVDVAKAVYDSAARIYGNWPANTAVAGRLLGDRGWAAVVKMAGFDEVEREIAARRPVALSHRWERGELTNAPVSRSNGHLIVCVGFTPTGDVIVNDPAGKPGEVRRVYPRRELFRTWQVGGEGIAYIVRPA